MWLHGFSGEVEEAWKGTRAVEETVDPEIPREHWEKRWPVGLHICQSETQERDLGWEKKKKKDLGVAAHER